MDMNIHIHKYEGSEGVLSFGGWNKSVGVGHFPQPYLKKPKEDTLALLPSVKRQVL